MWLWWGAEAAPPPLLFQLTAAAPLFRRYAPFLVFFLFCFSSPPWCAAWRGAGGGRLVPRGRASPPEMILCCAREARRVGCLTSVRLGELFMRVPQPNSFFVARGLRSDSFVSVSGALLPHPRWQRETDR